jgi:hypothetical protein
MHTFANENRFGIFAALLLALALVLLVDLLTNRIPTPRFDGREYVAIATNGIINSDDVEAPFAYRIGAIAAAAGAARLFNLAPQDGFVVTLYVGVITQMLAVYLLARGLGAAVRPALLIVALVGLSFAHLKFLLFDPYRPDHFAYLFFALAFLWLMQRRYLPMLIIIGVGLLFREFLLVPLALFYGVLLAERQSFSRREWVLWALGGAVVLLIGVVLPRLLIPVTATKQDFDPLNNPDTLQQLTAMPLQWNRNFNLIFATAAYFLPTLRLLAAALRPHWRLYALYGGVMFVLLLYGGSDLFRFATYFFAMQTVFLIILLRAGAAPWEIALLLVAQFVFNRIGWEIPFVEDLNPYLDFIGGFGYADRITDATLRLVYEFFGWLGLVWGVRLIIWFIRSRRTVAYEQGLPR